MKEIYFDSMFNINEHTKIPDIIPGSYLCFRYYYSTPLHDDWNVCAAAFYAKVDSFTWKKKFWGGYKIDLEIELGSGEKIQAVQDWEPNTLRYVGKNLDKVFYENRFDYLELNQGSLRPVNGHGGKIRCFIVDNAELINGIKSLSDSIKAFNKRVADDILIEEQKETDRMRKKELERIENEKLASEADKIFRNIKY